MLLIAFSLLLSVALFLQLGFAQTRSPGVSEGDWFKYTFSFEWNSDMNMSFEDMPFADFIGGEYVTLTIQQISGTNVTGQFTVHFENGTEEHQTASVDLVTGEGDLRNWVVSAGLGADDSLYTVDVDEKINETVTKAYHSSPRDTNHLTYLYNYSSEEDYSNLSLDMFWDQDLGVLTELSFAAEAQVNGTYMDASASWIITDSNIEDIPEFTQTIFILTIAATALLIVVIKKKGKLHI